MTERGLSSCMLNLSPTMYSNQLLGLYNTTACIQQHQKLFPSQDLLLGRITTRSPCRPANRPRSFAGSLTPRCCLQITQQCYMQPYEHHPPRRSRLPKRAGKFGCADCALCVLGLHAGCNATVRRWLSKVCVLISRCFERPSRFLQQRSHGPLQCLILLAPTSTLAVDALVDCPKVAVAVGGEHGGFLRDVERSFGGQKLG